jgi:hypothetical protein
MSRLLVPSLAAAALVATIGYEIKSASSYSAAETPGRPALVSPTAVVPARAPADPVEIWVATSLERPLMRESRRPDRAAGDGERKNDDVLRLAGVVTGPFGDRAIFVLPGVAKPVVANVGGQLGDLVVRSIEPGRVVVEANGVTRAYRPMYSGSNRKPVAALKRS